MKPTLAVKGTLQQNAQRAHQFPNAYDNWKVSGDAQPHWAYKFYNPEKKENPLIVYRDGEGFVVGSKLVLSNDAEHYGRTHTESHAEGLFAYISILFAEVVDGNKWITKSEWFGLPLEFRITLLELSWTGVYYTPIRIETINSLTSRFNCEWLTEQLAKSRARFLAS